jgi:hypothetical protein
MKNISTRNHVKGPGKKANTDNLNSTDRIFLAIMKSDTKQHN